MRLLDLYCGAGGCSVGYSRAGFEVVGVDSAPMKRYPFEFHQADALEFLAEHGHEFDAIHASPPCQKYSAMKSMPNAKDHPDLVEPTRELLKKIGKPYVIENVPGSPLMRGSVMLCGTMFALRTADDRAELRRHRWFETSFMILNPMTCQHFAASTIGVYVHAGGHSVRDFRRSVIRVYGQGGCTEARRIPEPDRFSVKDRSEAMGIDWMTGDELSQAIPPAYTFWIGERLMEYLKCHA